MNIDKNTIIFIAFTLTIFMLLVIQLTQLLQQYLLPFLREQISNLYKLWETLQDKILLLSSTEIRLQNKIETQRIELLHLETKLQQWHNALQTKQTEITNAFIEKNNAIKQKQIKQRQYISIIQQEIAIAPEIIAETRRQLKEKLRGQKGKEFLSTIITKLNTDKTLQ